MIRLRRIDIKNFIIFDHIVIKPSVDPVRRLTVIRAENGSGKTTFLRAVRWGMYGERGLPRADWKKFAIHPVDWSPDERGIETVVEIEFETNFRARTRGTIYNLRRSAITTSDGVRSRPGDLSGKSGASNFRRQENVQLMEKGVDGKWNSVTGSPKLVIEQLLPWELRELFVMDADAVTDFVGGVSDDGMITQEDVIKKTTQAIEGILGIKVFKMARERVEKIKLSLFREAAKDVKDKKLDTIVRELSQLTPRKEVLKNNLNDQRQKKSELNESLQRAYAEFETAARGVGEAGQLAIRKRDTERQKERTLKKLTTTLRHLSGQLESTKLHAALCKPLIHRAYTELKPLHDAGLIPLTHVHFVRELLDKGVCVCGQDLSTKNVHRQRVEKQIADATDHHERAGYLSALYDAAHTLSRGGHATEWHDQTSRLKMDVGSLHGELSDLDFRLKEIEGDLMKINEGEISNISKEIEGLKEQLGMADLEMRNCEMELGPIKKKIESLDKQRHQISKRKRVASFKEEAGNLANAVETILTDAYTTIKSEQVEDLSRCMDKFFAEMVINISGDDFVSEDVDEKTLRIIKQVGLRTVGNPVMGAEKYEICAFNNHGHAMQPTEINGASRRVLALSFVLALCKESRTFAPLVADSMLNFMSGAVRRNTLQTTVKHSSQPILLLTGSDLEGEDEAEIVSRYGGATFTLTGQWDVGKSKGSVLNCTEDRRVAIVCECGPREFCDVCERKGQRQKPGWSMREDGGQS